MAKYHGQTLKEIIPLFGGGGGGVLKNTVGNILSLNKLLVP